MADRTLIILGASVRAAAQSAVRSGYRPYGIDLFADADLRELGPTRQISRYPAEFLAALAAAPQAPWIYTGGLENYPRLVARLAQLRPLIGNGPDVLRRVRDPRWLAELLRGEAIRYPPIALTLDELPAAPANWLRKPRRSGGGLRIARVRQNGEAFRTDRRFYFQEWLAGEALSAAFVVVGGHAQWIGASTQWIGREWGAPGEFHYAGSCAPAAISPTEQADLLRIAQRLVDETGLVGLCGFDLVRTEQGLFLIEVNPRYTASLELLEAVTGRRLIAEHCGDNPAASASPPAAGFHAKLVVYASVPGIAGNKLQQILARLAETNVRSADLPVAGAAIDTNSPICTLLLAGNKELEMRDKLRTAAAAVQASLNGT